MNKLKPECKSVVLSLYMLPTSLYQVGVDQSQGKQIAVLEWHMVWKGPDMSLSASLHATRVP